MSLETLSAEQKLETITSFIESNRNYLKEIKGWWPAYIDNPREGLPILVEALKRVKGLIFQEAASSV